MSLAARAETVTDVDAPSDGRPWGKFQQADAYAPDLEAYRFDPRNDRRALLAQHREKGLVKSLDLQVTCTDGRQEFLRLSEGDAKAYFDLDANDLDGRHRFVNARITERRLVTAASGYEKLAEGRRPTADEEACLREFGGIVTIPRTSLREGVRPVRAIPDESTCDVLRPRFLEAVAYARPILNGGNTKLREDDFWDGGYDPPGGIYSPWSDREYLVRGGPSYRQQLVADVWDAQAKNFYAWTHDPVVREGCAILTEFPLGRGVQIVANDKSLQNFLDDTGKRLEFDVNLRTYTNTLSRDGELILLIHRNGDGTIDLEPIDPQTIWEVVTSATNVRKVYYFLQRYATRWQMDSALIPDAQWRYVDRTLAAGDVIFVKLNADGHDVRGRSDIFPALGWAKRLRDYADAEVQKSQAHAAYQWWMKVKGGSTDLSRIAGLIPSGRPQPGSSFVTNEGVDITAIASGASGSTSANGSTYELLLNQIALAFGVPKDYFGVTSRGSRATALVAADPASKRFEDRQNIIKSQIVEPIIAAAIAEARAHGLLQPKPKDKKGKPLKNTVTGQEISGVEDWSWRASFPAIIKADAATRATLLRQACAAGVISHKTMANEMVGELDLEDFDYDDEQDQIKTEIGVPGWELSAKDISSVKRGLPEESDVAWDPGEVPNPDAGGGEGGEGGEAPDLPHDAGNDSPSSASGAAKIRNEVGAHEARMRSLARLRVQEAARIVSAAGGVVVLP